MNINANGFKPSYYKVAKVQVYSTIFVEELHLVVQV